MLSRNEAFSVRSSFFRHSNLKKSKALSLTVSASSYYLKLTEIEKGVGVHCERVACRAAVSFSSPCCLWYCCSVGKHLEACCLIIPGAQSAQFNIHSGHRGKMLWLTLKGLSDIAMLMLLHTWCRTWWLNGSRTQEPRRLGFVSCMELIVIPFTLFFSVVAVVLDGWFVYRQNYTETTKGIYTKLLGLGPD